jgi:adenylate cyclase, class 2
MLEIEQKFPLADVAALWERLAAEGVVFGPPVRQVDTYFAHPARDFRQTDEAFRLRQVGDDNRLTYKGPKLDSTTKTRREIEVPLAPGTVQAADYQSLLHALGFTVGGLVRKTRRTARVDVDGFSIEVAWDEVDRLGVFVELEIRADDEALPRAKEALAALARRWRLTASERRSYLELLSMLSSPT